MSLAVSWAGRPSWVNPRFEVKPYLVRGNLDGGHAAWSPLAEEAAVSLAVSWAGRPSWVHPRFEVKQYLVRANLDGGHVARFGLAITNIVWCMAYNRGVGGGAYIAQWPCISIAIAGFASGGGNKRMIEFHNKDLK